MAKAQIVLRQLFRYGIPAAIAISVTGSFVLLSGNTYIIDLFNNWKMFNQWFNTNHHYPPNEPSPTDDRNPVNYPHPESPDINIKLPPVSFPINVSPDVDISPNIDLRPHLEISPEVQFSPELNPQIDISPTLQLNPEFNSNFGFTPSLDIESQIKVSPNVQINPGRTIVFSNSDEPFNIDQNSSPKGATVQPVPKSDPQSPRPTPYTPTQLSLPKELPKDANVSSKLPNPFDPGLTDPSDEPLPTFQFPEVSPQPTPITSSITFDPEKLPPDTISQQPKEHRDFPGSNHLSPKTPLDGSQSHPIDSSEKSVTVPEPGMVMTILLFGLGFFGFRRKR
ncbi:hypothetical protein [Leptothoe sp. PORK10 BA2]|uniref:hypothetical protein n=1 Tax=Leptothoe sp. PORK10 BA2 TaxID=3110254 RepID=UPI002B1F43F1|nr:hypothetical protein [Leptothoe sp. PORK10 BA2]MEA5464588.1 hypothetical protein [Leptothoe sp. PORK10 BA2]